MPPGKFIVFEGGEGSGKTTMVERLKEQFRELVIAQDPGGTPLGQYVREFLLSDRSAGIDARAELLLFLAARAELIEKIIKPALAAGKNVIGNRFSLSSIAYQVYGRQRPDLLSLVQRITAEITKDCMPNATILLDVTPEKGVERVHSRPEEPTRFDKENLAFHARVREGFKKHAADLGKVFVVDADRQLEEVWTEVKSVLTGIL